MYRIERVRSDGEGSLEGWVMYYLKVELGEKNI